MDLWTWGGRIDLKAFLYESKGSSTDRCCIDLPDITTYSAVSKTYQIITGAF